MRSGFAGFPAEGMQFLATLARRNKREWFQPRKHIFDEKVKAPMEEMVEAVNGALAEFAPDFVTEPKQAIYRIYRDTRFSNDKTPYKTHIAASFPRRGSPKHGEGGYYFSVSPKEIEVGGGVYLPQPETLQVIRKHIATTHEELRAILAARPVKKLLGDLLGDQLSRLPKGFDCDHPAADLLRYKSFILFTTLPGEIATTTKLYKEIVDRFRAIAPFIDYLSRSLVQPKKKKVSPVLHFDDRHRPVNF
jgi:uncharacterized protein (TIGR02453 family)